MRASQASPNLLMWMLIASTLMLLFGYAGVPAGLLLASMVVFHVSRRPDLPRRFWYALAALPLTIHLWATTVFVILRFG